MNSTSSSRPTFFFLFFPKSIQQVCERERKSIPHSPLVFFYCIHLYGHLSLEENSQSIYMVYYTKRGGPWETLVCNARDTLQLDAKVCNMTRSPHLFFYFFVYREVAKWGLNKFD